MFLPQCLLRKLTSDKLDAKIGQSACWLGAGVVLVAGMLKLTSLQLTEFQLLAGILLVLAVALLGVVLGVLLPIVQYVEQKQRDHGER